MRGTSVSKSGGGGSRLEAGSTLFETPPGVNERSREKGARRARWPLVIERDSVQLYLMATFSTVMAEAAAHPARARHDFQAWRGRGGGGGRLMSRWTREERSKGCSEESEEEGRVESGEEMEIYLEAVARFNRATGCKVGRKTKGWKVSNWEVIFMRGRRRVVPLVDTQFWELTIDRGL